MSSLVTELFGRPHAEVSERELLYHIIERITAMALDLSAVTSTLATLQSNVNLLIAADQSALNASAAGAAQQLAADQAAVNGLVQPIANISAVITAALTPAAPTGTTGPTGS
jgi:hypothetical protein